MAFDIYAGPLCRWATGEWETVAAQIARLQGIRFITLPRRESEEIESGDALAAIIAWKQDLIEAQQKLGVTVEDWREDMAGLYDTDRPGWEGLTALILKAAYLKTPGLKPPKKVPSIEDAVNDPAVLATQSDPVSNLWGELFLPGGFVDSFEVSLFGDRDVLASSHRSLISQLTFVARSYGKTLQEVAIAETDQPAQGADLDTAAYHGLAVFARIGLFAVRENVPLIHDY